MTSNEFAYQINFHFRRQRANFCYIQAVYPHITLKMGYVSFVSIKDVLWPSFIYYIYHLKTELTQAV